MKDSVTIKCTVPVEMREVQITNGLIFVGKDGVYHLPAGAQVAVPMAQWDKLSTEIREGKDG